MPLKWAFKLHNWDFAGGQQQRNSATWWPRTIYQNLIHVCPPPKKSQCRPAADPTLLNTCLVEKLMMSMKFSLLWGLTMKHPSTSDPDSPTPCKGWSQDHWLTMMHCNDAVLAQEFGFCYRDKEQTVIGRTLLVLLSGAALNFDNIFTK